MKGFFVYLLIVKYLPLGFLFKFSHSLIKLSDLAALSGKVKGSGGRDGFKTFQEGYRNYSKSELIRWSSQWIGPSIGKITLFATHPAIHVNVQFSSVPGPIESSGGRCSRDPLSAFSAGGLCEQFWHGQGCPIFDCVQPAFPLPTSTSPTLQGVLKNCFGETVVACARTLQVSVS